LEVEADRLSGSALQASLRREAVMKNLFHEYWVKTDKVQVFLRFGRKIHRLVTQSTHGFIRSINFNEGRGLSSGFDFGFGLSFAASNTV
jgi:hypothetical protein